MQRIFHCAPGESTLAERPASELRACRREGGWIWLDLTAPDSEEIWEAARQFDLDRLSVEDVIDVTIFPKVDHHDDYLFVVLHGVITGEGARLRTTEVEMFIGTDFLVTMHMDPVAGVKRVADQVASSTELGAGSPALLAAAIAESGSRRYLPLLDALDERIDELEDLAVAAEPATLSETQALRRDVIVLRRIVGPQREVLRHLSQAHSPLVDRRAERAFADTYDHYFRLVESLDSNRALLGSVIELYRGAVAERANEVMKVLTVFSAILLPLGLIAGIWGMNFANIPAADRTWGIFAVIGTMAVIAIGLWVYFAKRGFVGGPKLRDLPKAVGLGMVHLGTAPLRVVTRRNQRMPVKPPSPESEPDLRGD